MWGEWEKRCSTETEETVSPRLQGERSVRSTATYVPSIQYVCTYVCMYV